MQDKGCIAPQEQGLVFLSQSTPGTEAILGEGQAMARLQEAKCWVEGPDKQVSKSQQVHVIS